MLISYTELSALLIFTWDGESNGNSDLEIAIIFATWYQGRN